MCVCVCVCHGGVGVVFVHLRMLYKDLQRYMTAARVQYASTKYRIYPIIA